MPTPEARIEAAYGFAFPPDFFRFADLLAALPDGLLPSALAMSPDAPFRIAAGLPPDRHPDRPTWADRYYDDLPEFVTLFTGYDGLHWGYFFDSPGELPPVVASYLHRDTFEHAACRDGVSNAVRLHVEQSEIVFAEMIEHDPDEEEYYRDKLAELVIVRDHLAAAWRADRPQTGQDYLDEYNGQSGRVETLPTWSRMGVVVPPGSYRPIGHPNTFRARPENRKPPSLTPAAVGPLVAAATAHLAAGYPGSALQLGHDLWCWAGDYPACYDLLDAAYAALGREPLRKQMHDAREYRAHCDAGRRKSAGG